MFVTEYNGVTTLARNTSFIGGICKWWYTPVENILAWPQVDPLTQEYMTEPTLQPGKTWYGPVKVPDSQLGLDEQQKSNAAGHFFDIIISGFHPGDERNSRVNLQNLPNHKYIVVAKQRAGGFYLMIGNPNSPLFFQHNYSTGKGWKNSAGSTFELKTQMRHLSVGLEAFAGDNSAPPVTTGEGPATTLPGNDAEIITFINVSQVVVPWSNERKIRFGSFPEIEVWINDGPGNIYKENSNITVDLQPPATTQFTINLTGNASGWIVLK